MRIVLIDGMDIGAENLARLEGRGEVRSYDGMPESRDDAVARARHAEVVLNSWTRMDADFFARVPDLRMVSLAATGTDLIDVEAAARHGVTVCRVPHYATIAVAELALGLMLAVARFIPAVDCEVRRACAIEWDAPVGGELSGKTLGIIGTGEIGRHVAKLARCFGMELIGYDLRPAEALTAELGLRYVPLPELLAESDFITLHAPLMPETAGMIGPAELRRMKEGAILINTARARLVDQDALYEALRERRLGGAGLDDVDLSRASGRGLLELNTVVVTPHTGYKTREAVANLAAACAENVVRFIDGAPCNVVAPPAH